MIVEFFCDIFFFIVGLFVSLLPQFPSFEHLNASLTPILYCIRLVNMFVSVRVIGNCLILVLVIHNIKFIWSILMWLIRKLPGVS